jgi:hypothetical protein
MRLMLAIAIAATMMSAPVQAKKKAKPASSAQANKKKDNDKSPPPNYKGTNEGAQGRMNATEDAARGADSPQFEHRP